MKYLLNIICVAILAVSASTARASDESELQQIGSEADSAAAQEIRDEANSLEQTAKSKPLRGQPAKIKSVKKTPHAVHQAGVKTQKIAKSKLKSKQKVAKSNGPHPKLKKPTQMTAQSKPAKKQHKTATVRKEKPEAIPKLGKKISLNKLITPLGQEPSLMSSGAPPPSISR